MHCFPTITRREQGPLSLGNSLVGLCLCNFLDDVDSCGGWSTSWLFVAIHCYFPNSGPVTVAGNQITSKLYGIKPPLILLLDSVGQECGRAKRGWPVSAP